MSMSRLRARLIAGMSVVRETPGLSEDERFACLEPAQREQAFATYQQEERERQRAAARRDFEALLAERHAAGGIHRKTKWKELAEALKDSRHAAEAYHKLGEMARDAGNPEEVPPHGAAAAAPAARPMRRASAR